MRLSEDQIDDVAMRAFRAGREHEELQLDMIVVTFAVAFAASESSQAPRNQVEMIANIRINHFDGLGKGLPLTCEITGDYNSAPVEAAHEYPHSNKRSKQVRFDTFWIVCSAS